jgi:hypothetical protein
VKLKSYEVEIRATVHVAEAEDETDAMEQAKFAVEMAPDIVCTYAESCREIG